MHLEEFAEGSTLLHRLDPRVKFLSAGPFMCLTAVMPGIKGPTMALAAGLFLSALARLDVKKLAIRLVTVNIFVLLLWLFLPLSYPGEPLLVLGKFSASREGVLYVLGITLKTNAIVLTTIAVFGTSEAFSLAHALVHMKVPVKLVYLFFFFYRYISVLHNEYTRLRHAMTIRGFRPSSDIHTYKAFANLIGMLMIRSHERSRRIYNAMLCRGFKGYFPITHHFHLHKVDIGFAVTSSMLTFTLAWYTFGQGVLQ